MFIKKPIRQSLRDRLFALILFAALPGFYNAIDDHETAVAEVNDSANRIVRLAV